MPPLSLSLCVSGCQLVYLQYWQLIQVKRKEGNEARHSINGPTMRIMKRLNALST